MNNGTPWTGTIATPPVAPAFAIVGVAPSSGRLGGGQTITITGAGFQQGARVYFDNATWTGDRNANTKLVDVDQATDVVVSPDGTTITAKTPPRDFYNGYQTAGPTTVRVVNPDTSATTLSNGYTFKLNVLAFGDDYVFGSVAGGRAATPWPARLQASLQAYQKDVLNSTTGVATGHEGAAVRSVRHRDQRRCRRRVRLGHRRRVRQRGRRGALPVPGRRHGERRQRQHVRRRDLRRRRQRHPRRRGCRAASRSSTATWWRARATARSSSS